MSRSPGLCIIGSCCLLEGILPFNGFISRALLTYSGGSAPAPPRLPYYPLQSTCKGTHSFIDLTLLLVGFLLLLCTLVGVHGIPEYEEPVIKEFRSQIDCHRTEENYVLVPAGVG